jgi:hypothetical protein
MQNAVPRRLSWLLKMRMQAGIIAKPKMTDVLLMPMDLLTAAAPPLK